ncbi:hypothetical protein E1A91_A09G072000v1 [Gossypium mustelinum]|uniref:Pentacotripeptide-repeat region of PRORP domain-containing protein n=1 Tax=Gossypium mustelinum TaxID=34275 RepID=A0A5D2XUT6_GOSMU|nr:hypothetical protein E1A91_A09G072000v1 [Gossypium mustelinum]
MFLTILNYNRGCRVMLSQVMDQKGLSPDSYSYAALCGGLLKIGKVGDACELLLDIFSNGAADVAVYNIYFQCLCQENKSREALSQLKRKMKVGFKPNNVSYNTILSGFCKEKKNINEAMELLYHFEWDVNGPDAVTVNAILSTACRLGNSTIFQRILYHMTYEDMKLNIFKWFKW